MRVVMVMVVGLACAGGCERAMPAQASGTYDPSKQPERQKLIDRMIADGVFTRVEAGGTTGTLHVGKRFADAKLEEKKSFASMVYAYCITANPRCDMLSIRDGYDGKAVGSYTPSTGLILN